MYKKQKMENVRKNLQYLLNSRGETQISLCQRSGLNRTTIYNILDGRVYNVHTSTIQKVSNFFGVSYHEIERTDLAEKERINTITSVDGNMNPCAVPVIVQSDFSTGDIYNEKIGLLVSEQKLTYYFGQGPNIIGVLLEKDIAENYNAGDLLIIKRGTFTEGHASLYYNKLKGLFVIRNFQSQDDDGILFIGEIMEERYNYGTKI